MTCMVCCDKEKKALIRGLCGGLCIEDVEYFFFSSAVSSSSAPGQVADSAERKTIRSERGEERRAVQQEIETPQWQDQFSLRPQT